MSGAMRHQTLFGLAVPEYISPARRGACGSKKRSSFVIFHPASSIRRLIGRLIWQPPAKSFCNRIEEVLPPRHLRIIAAPVFEEDESPFGFEHPPDFCQRRPQIGD